MSFLGSHDVNTYEELLSIVESIPVDGKYRLVMEDKFGFSRYFMLNNLNRAKLIQTIQKAVFGEIAFEENGSDADFILEGDQSLLGRIIIEPLNNTATHESTEGGFFPFYNKTYLDLSKLGIFTREQFAELPKDYFEEKK